MRSDSTKAIPPALAEWAVDDGLEVIQAHPGEDARGDLNPPIAAFRWWSFLGKDGHPFFVVAHAALSEIPGGMRREREGYPAEWIRPQIRDRIVSMPLNGPDTVIYELGEDRGRPVIRRYSVDEQATARAQQLGTILEPLKRGAMHPAFQQQVAAEVVEAWPDAAERAELATELTRKEAAENQELWGRYSEVMRTEMQKRIAAMTQEMRELQPRLLGAVKVSQTEVLGRIDRALKPRDQRTPYGFQYL